MLPKKDLISQPGTDDEISASQGRLQRDSLHGARITTFRQVLLRHGLFLVLLATLCVFLPNAFADLSRSTRGLFASPQSYALAFLGLLVFLVGYSQLSDKVVNRKQLMWIGYLLLISIVEEWVFRLVLPNFLNGTLAPLSAVVVSNALFAGIHFFTLRWRLIWVIFAFIGGLGLSRAMSHGDLLLVIWLHWAATFLNTPFPPGVKQRKAPSP